MNTILFTAHEKIIKLRADAVAIEEAMTNEQLIELRCRFPSWESIDITPDIELDFSGRVVITLGGYQQIVSYEELLQTRGAYLSRSKEKIEFTFRELLLFTNIEVRVNFRAQIPKDDRELLKKIYKMKALLKTNTAGIPF